MQNNLHEVWALLNFLFPTVFPDSEKFDEGFNLKSGEVRLCSCCWCVLLANWFVAGGQSIAFESVATAPAIHASEAEEGRREKAASETGD